MKRVRIRLRGIVQGVGFRPFVHNLAARWQLAGYVLNSSAGLLAEVEGAEAAVDRFVAAVREEAPPLAWIQEMEVAEIALAGGAGFEIRASAVETGEFALISPDVATCPDCLRDCREPGNRRFGYPFTNCTNCGPRYTIIRDIPYDREATTMAQFSMCAECRKEYHDPANRRFHAQPNACPACGPSLSGELPLPSDHGLARDLVRSRDREGAVLTETREHPPACPTDAETGSAGAPLPSLLTEARERLAAGEIVAIKGLGGFHLACDARNPAAVERLRTRKRRSDKPFALMARDLAAVEALCQVSDADRAALLGWRRPIVLLPRRPAAALPEAVAPGNRTLGVMLPYTPLHHLLFDGAPFDALVMTSGNLSEEPIVVDNQEARERIGGVAGWFLTHNRDIYMRTDDSVVRTFEGRERVLRRSRGYAPQTLDLGRTVPELLACGGELKNAFCLTKGRHAILSQHIGDLENYETLCFFEETLANLKKLFRVTPRAVAHDLHPLYLSTRYALELAGVPKIAVQHHHAHIASCMAENGLAGEVIGVAFDGTGYGTDGAIWGGEFLVAGYGGFHRRAHLRYIPLAGGDAAVRQPWRPALAYLMDTFGAGAPFEAAPPEHIRVVRRMIAAGVNSTSTSSCGRLFDAVASLAGLRQEVNFEGQAAIELEMIAEVGCAEVYPYGIDGEGPWELDFRPAIESIVRDVSSGVARSRVAAKFHNALAAATVEVCGRIAGETALRRVCLSGGTFQNMRLLGSIVAGLRARGLEVFLHARVPPNDGGIALGQAAIAARLQP
jgi:hydrogenase maturation protein HypF